MVARIGGELKCDARESDLEGWIVRVGRGSKDKENHLLYGIVIWS